MNAKSLFLGFAFALLVASASVVKAQQVSPRVWAEAYAGYIQSTVGRRGYSPNDPRTTATKRGLYKTIRGLDQRGYANVSKFLGKLTPWTNAAFFAGVGLKIYGIAGGGVEVRYDGTRPTVPPAHHDENTNTIHRWWVSGSTFYGASMEQVLAYDYANRTVYGGIMGHRVNGTSDVTNLEIACDPNIYHVQGIVGFNDDNEPIYGPVRNISCRKMPIEALCWNNALWDSANGGSCIEDNMEDWFTPPVDVVRSFADFEEWYNSLSNAEKDQLASPELHAEIANQLWEEASKDPETGSIPHNRNRPVTRGDVDAPPDPNVRVRDVVEKPFPDWGADADPEADPDTIPGDPDGMQIDWGDDPGTPEPELEEPPSDILAPLVDALQPLMSFSLAVPNEACPVWSDSVTVRGHTWAIDISDHCIWLEEYYSLIYMVMLAGWGLVGFWIVMEA